MRNERQAQLPKNLKIARVKKDLSQAELAAEVGCNSQTISRYETGTISPPVGRLAKIAEILGVTTDSLLGINNNCTDCKTL